MRQCSESSFPRVQNRGTTEGIVFGVAGYDGHAVYPCSGRAHASGRSAWQHWRQWTARGWRRLGLHGGQVETLKVHRARGDGCAFRFTFNRCCIRHYKQIDSAGDSHGANWQQTNAETLLQRFVPGNLKHAIETKQPRQLSLAGLFFSGFKRLRYSTALASSPWDKL